MAGDAAVDGEGWPQAAPMWGPRIVPSQRDCCAAPPLGLRPTPCRTPASDLTEVDATSCASTCSRPAARVLSSLGGQAAVAAAQRWHRVDAPADAHGAQGRLYITGRNRKRHPPRDTKSGVSGCPREPTMGPPVRVWGRKEGGGWGHRL